ncbi:LytTR family DNA-binding domain-containing protein [uncultured Acetatifactor sp.]|uniref:LytR/AlgR family response regulator transcription factor n=1 Tax=uncultured Acetatifactor sp. TaxID=1671927 RepID=UPI00262F33EA|nr:LytTR family DNA-binding domain-containing protein [uncultured Acetatifactor sp.]
MGKIRIAICDDEPNMRSYLAALIRREDASCRISEYASAEAYLAAGEDHDLLLLDIELGGETADSGAAADGGMAAQRGAAAGAGSPGSMDGMALARRLRSLPPDRQPLIIFVTGYESYVYQAFDVEAFQYLVKPVDEGRFADVFRRAAEKLSVLEKQRQRTLLVQYAGSSRVIPLENIRYVESHGHKLLLHLKEGTVEYYGKIGELEQELGGQFARIHKGYLVNLRHVEEYARGQVTLTGGEKLTISKYKYDAFVKQHLRFLRQ